MVKIDLQPTDQLTVCSYSWGVRHELYFFGSNSRRRCSLAHVLIQSTGRLPSPAADHIEKQISLDELMSIRAPSVYLVKIDGESMQGAGIFAGDLAVVDRAIEPVHGHVVVGILNNDPLCKRLVIRDKSIIQKSENSKFPDRHILEGDEFSVWGVITYTVRSHLR